MVDPVVDRLDGMSLVRLVQLVVDQARDHVAAQEKDRAVPCELEKVVAHGDETVDGLLEPELGYLPVVAVERVSAGANQLSRVHHLVVVVVRQHQDSRRLVLLRLLLARPLGGLDLFALETQEISDLFVAPLDLFLQLAGLAFVGVSFCPCRQKFGLGHHRLVSEVVERAHCSTVSAGMRSINQRRTVV